MSNKPIRARDPRTGQFVTGTPDNTIEAFNDFGKKIVQYGRQILTSTKRNTSSKGLYNSLNYDVEFNGNSFKITFPFMEEKPYWKFVDQGVKGSESSSKAPNSPFSYKTKMPPISKILGWIKMKPLKIRDKKGKFMEETKSNMNSAAFGMAISIKRKGIKASRFYSKPFNTQYKNLPGNISEAFALDLETLFKKATGGEWNSKLKFS